MLRRYGFPSHFLLFCTEIAPHVHLPVHLLLNIPPRPLYFPSPLALEKNMQVPCLQIQDLRKTSRKLFCFWLKLSLWIKTGSL
jgi:hypothetical protein